jgi:hypothetical protein
MTAYSSTHQQPQPATVLWPGIQSKMRAWLSRYLPAEILGAICALVGASLAFALTDSAAAAAVAGAWTENVGFYGRLLARELGVPDAARPVGQARRWQRALRDIVLEFGPAEAIDSLLRPALMCAGTALLPDLHSGVIAGKLAADLVFYALAIAAHELRGKYLKRKAVLARSNV